MESFLLTLSEMYNISYSNILLLKHQRNNVSFVADKEKMEKYKFHIKDYEKPLKLIKRIQVENNIQFKVHEVYDISQTDAIRKKNKIYSTKYIEIILKGMCLRRGLTFEPNSLLLNVENIITDISRNSRSNNIARYNIDLYTSQAKIEVNATAFTLAKKFCINIRNYNVKDICQWGIDKDTRNLKESLKYIQKFTNYFIKDFQKQEKIYNLKNENQQDEEME